MTTQTKQTVAQLWRVMEYVRDRPQGNIHYLDDSRIFAHSVRYLKNAIETLENEQIGSAR